MAFAGSELKNVLPSPIWDTIIISDYACSFVKPPKRRELSVERNEIESFKRYFDELKSNVINVETCPIVLKSCLANAPYGSIIWHYLPIAELSKERNCAIYLICQEKGRRVILPVINDNWLIDKLLNMGRSLDYYNVGGNGCQYLIHGDMCKALARDLVKLGKIPEKCVDTITHARISIYFWTNQMQVYVLCKSEAYGQEWFLRDEWKKPNSGLEFLPLISIPGEADRDDIRNAELGTSTKNERV